MDATAALITMQGCRFCLDNGLLEDAPLFTGDRFYFLGSIDPLLPVAGMIVPFRHSETPFELDAAEWAEMGGMLGRAREHFASHRPAGFTIGWNVGAVAGQHVFHTHLHVIARFDGEPNAGVGLRRILRPIEDLIP